MLPFIYGAGDEARTRDLNLGKVALYQLSYSRVESRNYNAFRPVISYGMSMLDGIHFRGGIVARCGGQWVFIRQWFGHALQGNFEHFVDPFDGDDL